MGTHEKTAFSAPTHRKKWLLRAGPPRGKNYNAHARFPHKKWPPVRIAVIGGNAGSLQRSGLRENPTNFLTFVAR